MRQRTLLRFASKAWATYGFLFDYDGLPIAATLELPWADNHNDVSCIPFGLYHCLRIVSPKFGQTFEIQNVSGRSNIEFHKGNTATDTHGCVLLGQYFLPINGVFGVADSGLAFSQFIKRTNGEENFMLSVEEWKPKAFGPGSLTA